MTIEKIRFEDMPDQPLGRSTIPEFDAVRALNPGDAVKFACTWKHYDSNRTCGGATGAYTAAKKAGFVVKSYCRDGVVYVGRPA